MIDQELHNLSGEELSEKLEELSRKCVRLEGDLQEVLSALHEEGVANDRLRLDLEKKEEELESFKLASAEQLQHLVGKLDEKDEQLERLKLKLDDKDGIIEKLKARLDEKDATIQEIRSASTEQLQRLTARLDDKDAQIAKLAERLDDKDDKISRLKNKAKKKVF